MVTRAANAIGELQMPGAASRPRALAQLTAGRIQAHHLPPTNPSNPPIFWPAAMLLTGTVGSLRDVACAISDRVVPDRIRASPKVVFAPITVPPSSA
jgi:hypothetical protein